MEEERFQESEGDGGREVRGDLNRPGRAAGCLAGAPSPLAGLPDQEAQLNNGPKRVGGGQRLLPQPAMIHPLAPGAPGR